MVINDARHYLYATPRQFDVIVSDLFVPWHSQTGYLYTVEHYQAARRRLKPGGIFCQWLPLYQLGPREFEMIANSFATVFPQTTLWRGELSGDSPLMALVGSEQPLTLGAGALAARLATLSEPPWRKADVLGGSVDDLLTLYAGDWPSATATDAAAAQLNTDDHPRVEFLAPVSNRQQVTLSGARLKRYYTDRLLWLPLGSIRYLRNPDDMQTDLAAGRQVQFESLIAFPPD
jgi:spermidine synthase